MNKLTYDSIINKIKQVEFSSPGSIITFLNPYSYYLLRNKSLISDFDKIFIDGKVLVILMRIIGVKTERVSFDMTSLAPLIFNENIKLNKTIYFIGSTEIAINNFIKITNANFPKLIISGYRNGYFTNISDRNLSIYNIVKLKPDIVVVGMGTPFQEKFLIDLKNAGWNGVGYTCGGFIHQTTNSLNYYPKFYNKYNLRWLYRIIDEPKLFKRYIIFYPISICLFTFDVIRFRLLKL